VTRRAEGGGDPAEWQRAQRLSVAEVLQLLTARGAWSTFEEAEKGMLKEGLLADLVVLSDDPTKVALERLSEVEVLTTIVGGVVEHCAPGAEALCGPTAS
jgi:predicted amidohydrolase YtcJ